MNTLKINQLYRFAGICALTLKIEDINIAAKLQVQLNGNSLPRPYGGLILDGSGIILLLSKFSISSPQRKSEIEVIDSEGKVFTSWTQKNVPVLGSKELSDLPVEVLEQMADTLLNKMTKVWGEWTNAQRGEISTMLGIKLDQIANKKPVVGKSSTKVSNEDISEENFKEEQIESRFHADVVVKTKKGLIIAGWIFDAKQQVAELQVKTVGRTSETFNLFNPSAGVMFKRTLRPDVTDGVQPGFVHDLHGFVAYLPTVYKGYEIDLIALTEAGKNVKKSFSISPISDSLIPKFDSVWQHSGQSLLNISARIQDDPELNEFFRDIETASNAKHGVSHIAACDRVWYLNSEVLMIEGWISAPTYEIKSIKLSGAGKTINLLNKIERTLRTDLHRAFPWSINKPIGFIISIKNEELLGHALRLRVETKRGEVEVINLRPLPADWGMVQNFLIGNTQFAEPMIQSLTQAYETSDAQDAIQERLASIRHQVFLSIYRPMTQYAEAPYGSFASLDQAFPLGEGILLFGWHYEPLKNLHSVKLYSPQGNSEDISANMFKVSRMDVADAFRDRFPDIVEFCGFVVFVPYPTGFGHARALCFDCGDYGRTWLKVPTDFSNRNGLQLVKDILNIIPAPDKIQHKLYELFDQHLGPAINQVAKDINFSPAGVRENQFGTPPKSPKVTVIVPLYGRYDFLRHQVAHFSQDADFKDVDLIYVVDDPSIINPTIALAAIAYSAFNVPFRVISYEQNLGFGGANNVAAKYAKGEFLVLLNSDVIPTEPGWVSELSKMFDSKPDVGAVGPLLLFADGSIQHAGMAPKVDARYPGFLLNAHPNKGQKWVGDDKPQQHPMLTAACLMLRKKDYQEIGGFDQGYLIGDFEDSDMCLALKKRGKSLWLVPKAKLWHLERQSQGIGIVAGFRQLITLYNGWRFKKKILNNEIASPVVGGAK